MRVQIENVRLVDPFTKTDKITNLFIENEHIVESLSASPERIIEGSGLCASPGFIDVHTHLRDPGFCHKEDIVSGTKAGAKGGFVLLCAMPNTKPVCDNVETVRYMIDKANNEGYCEVLPIAAATIGLGSSELSPYADLKMAGAGGLTDDGRPILDSKVLSKVLTEAAKENMIVIDHPEDSDLAKGTAMTLGEISKKLGVKGMPNSAESVCVARDILVAHDLKLPIHLCHLSTKESIELVRLAKQRGVRVTADVCPHHFALTDLSVEQYGANAKMYPPLRSEADRIAIIEGLLDGTVDMISTDHAPHHVNEKDKGLEKAPMGIVGLETAFGLSYTFLCEQNNLPLMDLIHLFTVAPAQLLDLERRSLENGNDANLTIFSVEEKEKIDVDSFVSKSKNSPFDGVEVTGVVHYTIWKGRLTYER